MRICPSCNGIIGRDCFNPVECAQITASMNAQQCNCGCEQLLNELSYIRGVDMPHLEQTIQEACDLISGLLDLLPHDIEITNAITYAEHFYRQHNNANPPENKGSSLDDLPF